MPVSRRRKSGKEKVNADRLQKQKEKSAQKQKKQKKALSGPFFSNGMIKARIRGRATGVDEVADFVEQK